VGFNLGIDKSLQYIQSSLGHTQSIQEVLVFFPGIKWPEYEVDHCALPSSAGF